MSKPRTIVYTRTSLNAILDRAFAVADARHFSKFGICVSTFDEAGEHRLSTVCVWNDISKDLMVDQLMDLIKAENGFIEAVIGYEKVDLGFQIWCAMIHGDPRDTASLINAYQDELIKAGATVDEEGNA